ncbi:MAG: protein phosphatase 2C domain-containing protein, partial [Mycoplasmatales bacterium]
MTSIKAITDVGLVREQNEDSYVIEENQLGHRLLLVADGMGGHNAGEIASHMVCQIISEEFNKITEKIDYKKFIEEVIVLANQKVYKESLLNTMYSKMGTTATLVIYDNEKIYTGHVGDSRVYFIDNSQIRQLTKDHTLVQAMVDT